MNIHHFSHTVFWYQSILLLATLVRLPGFILELRKRMHTPLRVHAVLHVRAVGVSVPTRGRDGHPEVRLEGSLTSDATPPMSAPAPSETADSPLRGGTVTLRMWVLGDDFWRGAKPAVGGMLSGLARGMMPLTTMADVEKCGGT